MRRLALGCVVFVACQAKPVPTETVATTTQPLVDDAYYYVGTGMAAKQLALTFDDGPNTRTGELSTFLRKEGIRATFFIVGSCVQATSLPNPNCSPVANAATILAQLESDGHLVANHSTTHRSFTAGIGGVSASQRVTELSETNTYVTTYGKTAWNRSLFRAPYGDWNGAVAATLRASAMANYVGPIYWDIGQGGSSTYPADWECWQTYGRTPAQCAASYRAEANAVGKGIVLMHDLWSETVDMVELLVPLLKADGFTFVRADEIASIAADFPACGAANCTRCSGSGANQCLTCAAGRYLSNGTCPACSTCAAGTYRSAACTATKNTVCTACPAGTYATTTNAASCTACGTCNDGNACTTDTCVATTGCRHTPIAGCGADAASPTDAGTKDASTTDASRDASLDAAPKNDAAPPPDADAPDDDEPPADVDPPPVAPPTPPSEEASTPPTEDNESGCQSTPGHRGSAWPALFIAAVLVGRRSRGRREREI